MMFLIIREHEFYNGPIPSCFFWSKFKFCADFGSNVRNRTLGKKQEKHKALIKIFCFFYFKLGNNGYLVESFREQGLPAWLAHPQQVSSKIGELKKGYIFSAWKTEIACSLFPKLLCLGNLFESIWNLLSSFEIWKFNLNLKILYPVSKFISNVDTAEWCKVCIQTYHMIKLNTSTWHYSAESMFEIHFRQDKTFSDLN